MSSTAILLGTLRVNVEAWLSFEQSLNKTCLLHMRTEHVHTSSSMRRSTFSSIVYNRAIVYKHQNFFNVVVYVIIIDQCIKSNPALDEIQVMVIYSRASLVAQL